MSIAFVLINTEPGHMESVLEALKKIDSVEEAYMVYGVYDVIAKAKADAMDKLQEIVSRHIRRLDKVRSTIILTVIEETK